MELSQSPLGKVPGLIGRGGKVALGWAGPRSWLYRFPEILLIAAAVGGPVTLAGGIYQQTSPSAQVSRAWLTSRVAFRISSQTITFDQPPDATVGTPVTLSAQASSGLPVTFSSGTPSVCTVAGSTVTTVAAGSCAITASQSGSTFYSAASDVTRSFPVQAPATPAITFDQPPDATVGTPVSLSASMSPPGLPVLFRSDTPPVCTVAGSTVTTVAAGTCTITAFQHGKAPAVTRSFQIRAPTGPARQTITFGQPPGATVGTPVTLSAHASSGLPATFSSGTPSVCTVAGSTVTTVAAGTCTITASQGGSARYAAAPAMTRSFQVDRVLAGPARQTITFGQPPGATVGTPVTLSAHASSGLPATFSSGTPSVCTVAGSTVTTVAAGTCTITASQSGSAHYATAPAVTRSFHESSIAPKAAGPPVDLLVAAAIALVAAAVAVTLAVWRRQLPPHPLAAPELSVRAVPRTGPPRLVSVHTTGTDATHTVRVETSSGTSTTTIEEARP